MRAPGWIRPVTFIAIVTVAYLFSFADLVAVAAYDTPLAYLGLVPILALIVGMWRYRQCRVAPPVVAPADLVMGGALILLAGGIGIAGQMVVGAYAYWVRLDLLSLPIFALGVLIILYGINACAWSGPAVAFACLVWPVPYQYLLSRILTPLAALTALGVRAAAAILPIGASVLPNHPSTFRVIVPGGSGEISVGTACAGFESVSTFAFLGIALLLVARPRQTERWPRTALRMVAWLGTGTLFVLVGNVCRILLVFLAAHLRGMDFAFTAVHPYAGIATLMLVFAVLVVLLRPFGLVLPGTDGPDAMQRRPWPTRDIRNGAVALATLFGALGLMLHWANTPLAHAGQRLLDREGALITGPLRVVAFLGAGALVVFLAIHLPSESRPNPLFSKLFGAIFLAGSLVLFSVMNTVFASVPAADGNTFAFALRDYDRTMPILEDVAPHYEGARPWLVQYYGRDSRRNVYHYPTPDEASDLWAIIDTTRSRASLNTYSLWSCYSYHGFPEIRRGTVSVGHGVIATIIDWYEPDAHQAWSSISWIQPIQDGNARYHQRIALNGWFAVPRGTTPPEAFFAPFNARMQRDGVALLNALWPTGTV